MFRIALTNLGMYNEGDLCFTWLELPATEEEIEEAMKKIHIGEPKECGETYEEWFISDYENDYGYEVGEYENLDELNEAVEELEELDSDEAEIYKAFREEWYLDHDEAINKIRERSYTVIYANSLDEAAEEYAIEIGDYEEAGRYASYVDWRNFYFNGVSEPLEFRNRDFEKGGFYGYIFDHEC